MNGLNLTNILLIAIAANTLWIAFYLKKIRELIGNELFRQHKERRGIYDDE